MNISVCIATYRRTERLRAVLEDLARQSRLPDQVVVVDNDLAGSARLVIEQLRASGAPFAIAYDVQPERNIAMTRNLTVAAARRARAPYPSPDARRAPFPQPPTSPNRTTTPNRPPTRPPPPPRAIVSHSATTTSARRRAGC